MRRRRGNGLGTLFKRRENGAWRAGYYTHDGKRRERSTGTTDRATAERILAKWVADAALRREGVIDPREDGYVLAERRHLVDHAADFQRSLQSRGNCVRHVESTHRMAVRVLSLAGAQRISQLTPGRLQEAIASLRKQGLSLSTCNAYLHAIKAFGRWLLRERLARDDATMGMRPFNAETQVVHVRRDLTEAEMAALLAATRARDIPGGMSGPDRAMFYKVAAMTGYRRGELLVLTPGSFALDAQPATINVAAAYTKARREDHQPIPRWFAEELRAWLIGRPVDQLVFVKAPKATARTLAHDLALAGIPYRDASGRVFDFHAFRGYYISRIERSGASIKTLQTLARHADPKLTLKRYVRLRVEDQIDAVERGLMALGDLQRAAV